MLETIEGALAGRRLAVRPRRLKLAGEDRHDRVLAQLIVTDEVLIAQGQPKTCCPTSVSRRCSTNKGLRRSVKQAANRRISPTPRSSCPKSRAPALEVIVPPSKSASTIRRSRLTKSSRFALHFAGSGAFSDM